MDKGLRLDLFAGRARFYGIGPFWEEPGVSRVHKEVGRVSRYASLKGLEFHVPTPLVLVVSTCRRVAASGYNFGTDRM